MSDHEPEPMSNIHEILDREFGWNHRDAYLRGLAEEISQLEPKELGPMTTPPDFGAAERDEMYLFAEELARGNVAVSRQNVAGLAVAYLALRAEVERLTRDVRTRDAMMDDMANRLAALREDKARLDALEAWMGKGEGMGVDMWRAGKYWGVWLTEHHDATTAHSARESTLRAALDAARASQQEGRDAV
jgi:hypothetical protein